MLNQKTDTLYSLDPFTYVVTQHDIDEGNATLLHIAFENIQVPLSDIRTINSSLGDTPADKPLPAGTVVHLPMMLDQRGDTCGFSFNIRTAETLLKKCEDDLNQLIEKWEKDIETLPRPVKRKILSPNEQVLQVIESEVTRQLPSIQKEYKAIGEKDHLLQFLVDVQQVKLKEIEVFEEMKALGSVLVSYDPKLRIIWPSTRSMVLEGNLTEHSIQTIADMDEDFCMEHTHCWEFMLLGPDSMEECEVWALLSCQKLTALLDAVACPPRRAFSPSKCGFIFVAGTFYVDDRTSADSDYKDISSFLRECEPSLSLGTEQQPFGGTNAAFKQSLVRSASEATFGDLHIKQGEACILRHAGGCTHYLYLQGPRSLIFGSRLQREQFPYRTRRKKDRVLRCQMCHQFPSSIAVYEDELSLKTPALYCSICYEYLHSDKDEADCKKYLKVMPQGVGGYFTCW